MAKPPKKVAGSASTDTPATTRLPEAEPLTNRLQAAGPSTLRLPGDPTPIAHLPNVQVDADLSRPAVIVSDMPQPAVESARNEIAWPRSRYAELTPFGAADSGLFEGPDLRIYAEIGTEGRFQVEQNAQGIYHVPLSFAPGVPGPVLAKIDGQPRWRIERPGWQSPPISAESPPTSRSPAYLAPQLTALLEPAISTDGIRYDKHNKAYVEMEGGMVLVGKRRDGQYQEISASERSSSGAEVEMIPGTKLWRRKVPVSPFEQTPAPSGLRPTAESDAAQPGPGKRPRLDAGAVPQQPTSADADQTPYFWLPWGHLNPPSSGESVQLGWLHYSIVPIGTAPNRVPKVYFLQHPEFAPAYFDAFEQMLRDAPDLQPVATFRIGYEPGEARPGKRFFEKPLSQSVAETFVDFSAFTSRAVARRLFELSDYPPAITATGLMNIQAVLHQWNHKPFPTVPAYADPLNLLSVASTSEIAGRKVIKLLPQVEGELHRLTFDPQHFAFEWRHYSADPSDYNLRRLVGALLIRSGYDVFPLTHDHRRPALVFKRADQETVFFLKLGVLNHELVVHNTLPGTELADPDLPARIGSAAHLALTSAEAQKNLVWLIGGVLKTESAADSVFILRER